jgi:hypothetical protein
VLVTTHPSTTTTKKKKDVLIIKHIGIPRKLVFATEYFSDAGSSLG